MGNRWVILTGEYPPQPGGVSDYTRTVAIGLSARGEKVDVWAPVAAGEESSDRGVIVHRLEDGFRMRGLRRLGAWLDSAPSDSRLLVQYVPHAYGMRALNVPFCLWLYARSRKNEIWALFHEVAYPLARGQPLRHNFLGVVNRLMAGLVARASRRVLITILAWKELLRPLGRFGQIYEWLPVPANVPAEAAAAASRDVRSAMGGAAGVNLVGHFGTFGTLIEPLLEPVLVELLQSPKRRVLLIGRGSREFAEQFGLRHPEVAGRVYATGGLPAGEIAAHLAACDVLVQPYPDGVSCRRTTVMAGLRLGIPIVTNLGHLSEPIWAHSTAVALADRPSAAAVARCAVAVLESSLERARLSERGRSLYEERFAVERTVDILLK